MTTVEPRKGIFVKSSRADQDGIEKTQVSLYPGDTIEYHITHEVELPDRTKMWVKVGSTTSVQATENGQMAANRLAGFVADQIRNRIVQAVAEAGDISL